MANQIQVLLTFALYLLLFGWIGYRRGMLRELIVFAVVVGTWVVLQEFGNVLVIITNLGGRFVSILPTGALTQGDAAIVEALGNAGDLVSADNAENFLFLLWALLLLLVYVATGLFIKDGKSKRNAVAGGLGMLNGIFYAVLLLPQLAQIFLPTGTVTGSTEAADAGTILRTLENSFGVVGESLSGLWLMFEAQRAFILLFLLTVLLLTASNTLTGTRAKKS